MNRIYGFIVFFFFPSLCINGPGQGAGPPPEEGDHTLPVPEVLFIPTPHDIVDLMLDLAKVHKEDMVYDLGCGDGRILVRAVQKCGCRGAGFDIDPRRIKQTLQNLRTHQLENRIRVEEKDLFQVDLRPASVVTLYLSPKYNARLIPQLEALKPGARIVSHQFGLKGIKPDKVIRARSKADRHIHTLFLWTTPLNKE